MTDDNDLASPAGNDQGEQLDEFRALVRSAFEEAHSKGKKDWETMTSAVLKNRLLNITRGQFSQDRYGSASFIHLVRRVPDLLDIVSTTPPFVLQIKSPISEQDEIISTPEDTTSPVGEDAFGTLLKSDLRQVRIRDDLWRAIVDYTSGSTYVLDSDTGLARPTRGNDLTLPQLPTASREEVSSWRHEFSESLRPTVDGRVVAEIEAWADGRGRQSDLPRLFRGKWAEFIKRKVIHILLGWFKERGMLPPTDMVFVTEGQGLPSSEAISEVVRTRQLRDLIIHAVRAMNYEELSQISLPASVVLRISERNPGRDD
jgi:hypothetical protein